MIMTIITTIMIMGIIVIKMCFCGPSYDTKDRSGLKVLLLILPLIHGGRELQGTMECIHKPPPPFRLLVTLLFILFISVSPVSFAIFFRYYCSSSFSSFLLLQYTFVSFLSTFPFTHFCLSVLPFFSPLPPPPFRVVTPKCYAMYCICIVDCTGRTLPKLHYFICPDKCGVSRSHQVSKMCKRDLTPSLIIVPRAYQ